MTESNNHTDWQDVRARWTEMGRNIHPRPGFACPAIGTTITLLQDYKACSSNSPLRAGDVGTVIGSRAPDTDSHGTYGLIAKFDAIAKKYPAGIVIFWDWASDPERFSYTAPAP